MKKSLILLLLLVLFSCSTTEENISNNENIAIDNYYGECYKSDEDLNLKVTINKNIMTFYILDENKKVISPMMEATISKISDSEAEININSVYFSDFEMGKGSESPYKYSKFTKESLINYYVEQFGESKEKVEKEVEDLFYTIDYEYKISEDGILTIDPFSDDKMIFTITN